MRRFLFAVLAATLVVAHADAGYFVVRIILEGGGGGGAGGAPGSSSGPTGGMPMPQPGPGSSSAGPTRGGPMGPPPAPGSSSGGPTGLADAGSSPQDPTRSIFVVIPVTKSPEVKNGQAGLFYPALKESSTFNPRWPIILHHPFGSTNLLVDSTQVQLYAEPAGKPATTKTYTSLVRDRHKEWQRTKDDTQKLLNVLSEALEVGLVDDAEKMADELLAAVKDVKDKKGTNTPAVERFAAAYGPLQGKLRARVLHSGDGPDWKERLGVGFNDLQNTPSSHYHVVTTGGTRAVEVQRRSEQLEANFRAFYLWHAARGVGLPLPEKQLPVILAGSATEVRRLREALDVPSIIADGFYSPDHDVLVLSPERLDEVGLTFQRQVNSNYARGVQRDRLLHPETYTPDSPIVKLNDDGRGKEGMKAADVARMMTWAMADAYNQHDTELAAVTREGCRQLFYATGLMPKHVSSPMWLAHGSAEFFHRPRGAVFTDGPEDKVIATVGLAPGYGAPNFAQQKLFRDFQAKKVLPADPAVVLKNVVTDAYFAAVSAKLDADDPKLPKPKDPPAGAGPVAGGGFPGAGVGAGPRPGSSSSPGPGSSASGPPPLSPMGSGPTAAGATGAPAAEDPVSYARRRQEFLVNKARSTSWALYHHLATNHPAELRRYFEELGKLPRDMPFDGVTNWDVFLRAFNLTTGSEAGKVSVNQFAADWFTGVASQRQTGEDLTLHAPPPPSANQPTGMPGMPGGGMPQPGPPSSRN
ncbi:hypothetical protein [Urbifossiella limnaea]|uniref:DUF1570 domain-containing protein n=1 Tax=Urbifossiella limnaea TaxID=2528023 RepID=A0A517XU52_9BACT|nr:hypothetical protein [Urbifossiella limnaea]QDU21041.1 hypothetical protein ETAA1_30050 [Urbifossiella limnaea]